MTKIITGIIAAVVHNGKVLMLKRTKEPFIGYWALPGGKIDIGEHPEETAVREIKEETGIDAEVVNVRGVMSEFIRDKKTKENIGHFVMFVCEMKPLHTNMQASEEGELKWFDIEDIKEGNRIVPSDVHIFHKIAMGEEGIPVHKSEILKEDEKYYLEAFGK